MLRLERNWIVESRIAKMCDEMLETYCDTSHRLQSSATWTGRPCSESSGHIVSVMPNQIIPHFWHWKNPLFLAASSKCSGANEFNSGLGIQASLGLATQSKHNANYAR